MPVYKCPKCKRTVELPEGKYYCRECGAKYRLVSVGLFKEVTEIPFYDEMLRNPDYFRKAKGLVFNIEYMSPDQYMQRIARMRKVPVSREWEFIDPVSIEYLLRQVEEGKKLPMPVIDYSQKNQEGRNRVAVAKKLGINKVPVMIVRELGEEFE